MAKAKHFPAVGGFFDVAGEAAVGDGRFFGKFGEKVRVNVVRLFGAFGIEDFDFLTGLAGGGDV